MPMVQRYRSDGSGRDLYIAGTIRHPQTGDLNVRMESLPANVKRYIRGQAQSEQYLDYTTDLTRTKNVNHPWEEGRGKSVPRRSGRDLAMESRCVGLEQKTRRHLRLKDLYAAETEQWDEELRKLGYAIEKDRD
eukprot:NODE_4628_length_782_cov_26.615280_g4285_i0.p1 GENE.NODE_4628_length_782_cov_26.615280_g4285_i0~~NODE_4628_length_782_cov_26.615280_g4285_i0.p1  ORF type:complete len:134 (-),score=22.49 NODE_4628_length_782_cov_26.615280_g4285_i0:228-629(-)